MQMIKQSKTTAYYNNKNGKEILLSRDLFQRDDLLYFEDGF